ncbi:Z1 domain-containing protein [Acinetobacter terrestris]|uniref:Z1 domain-containing protein n=1 Tax=Acinetobacter terrestris TaxID=2529843 RepID=UPI001BC877C1|nr:Z1 domain-containing protein [Acinetobacter terrestris]
MNLNGPFYSQFKSRNQNFSSDTFKCAEATILELLNKPTSSEHPGMLLGKVQSGKTRTFISTLALGFDNGYDIAIVLSKNSKALIQQTYKRLSKDFEIFIDDKELEIHDIMRAPKFFSKFELESKLIFVAKKQDDNLRRLIDLFENNPLMIKKRVLIIDDEADSASIGYTKKDDLINANKIASQISSLRSTINNISFLQVTATPYSLYLQPQEIETDNIIEFKPMRPAFTKLVPVPQAYVGGDTYFGENSKIENTIENLIHQRVEHNEFACLKKQDNRVFKISDVLKTKKIQGYRNALITFIVGGCIQRLNGMSNGENHKKLLYSFLVHSESGKPAHNWQETLTNAIIENLKLEANSNDNNNCIFKDLVQESYDNLSISLKLDNQAIPDFQEVFDEVVKALSEDYVTVTKVNSEENIIDMLDDTGQLKLRSPLHIFIGGQVLDRGITLSNLIGFYYGRRPTKFQQDTVLQHSRMYGYRRELLAITRFYTSSAIRSVMEKMEEFDSSLRSAIESGGDGAVQFIRQSTDGKIIPCNPNKILISEIQTLKPNTRILPVGFRTNVKTGKNSILPIIQQLDKKVEELIEFNSDHPKLVPVETAVELLKQIEQTIYFNEDDDAPPFNWDSAYAALIHLSSQHNITNQSNHIWLWAAKDRNSARLAGESSHTKYIATPDSTKTEGVIAKQFAVDHPILFLLRQNGTKDQGWFDTPFYWPVIRAQKNARTAIFAKDTIE